MLNNVVLSRVVLCGVALLGADVVLSEAVVLLCGVVLSVVDAELLSVVFFCKGEFVLAVASIEPVNDWVVFGCDDDPVTGCVAAGCVMFSCDAVFWGVVLGTVVICCVAGCCVVGVAGAAGAWQLSARSTARVCPF